MSGDNGYAQVFQDAEPDTLVHLAALLAQHGEYSGRVQIPPREAALDAYRVKYWAEVARNCDRHEDHEHAEGRIRGILRKYDGIEFGFSGEAVIVDTNFGPLQI